MSTRSPHLRSRTARAAAAALGTTLALAVPAAALSGRAHPPLPAEKQALVDRAVHDRSAALAAPRPPKDPSATPPRSDPEPAWRAGIIPSGQAPYPGALYRFENQWHDIIGGRHVNVYAGALRNDPEQGVVAVECTAIGPGNDAGPGDVYATPSRAGSVRIDSVRGTRLILVAADGTRLAFDAVDRTFVAL